MDRYVADPRIMSVEEIVGVLDKTWTEQDLIRQNLERRMPEVRERILNLFNEITQEHGLIKNS